MPQGIAQARPVETAAGVGLAPRRDIAVPTDTFDTHVRIGTQQRTGQLGQGLVLSILEWQLVGAFQLDTDGEIIAGSTNWISSPVRRMKKWAETLSWWMSA